MQKYTKAKNNLINKNSDITSIGVVIPLHLVVSLFL